MRRKLRTANSGASPMVPSRKPGHAQPVLVELQPRGQHIGNRLVKAGDKNTSDPRLVRRHDTRPTHHGASPGGGTRRRFDNLVDLDMSTDADLAAAILAGGRASRLDGVNKGTLMVGRSAIIDRQLDTLREVARRDFRGRTRGRGVDVERTAGS